MAAPKFAKGGEALLTKAVAAIVKHPETFDMGLFMGHDESVKGRAPYCGTVACLAGHIVLAAGVKPQDDDFYFVSDLPAKVRKIAERAEVYDGRVGVEGLASAALGLTTDEAKALFYTGRWPASHEQRYLKARTAKARAQALAKRVAHWLRTGL